MATKDITDAQVVKACVDSHAAPMEAGALDLLEVRSGQSVNVCVRAMERAARRGFIDYGVSLRTAWAEPKGKALLEKEAK